MNVVLAQVLRVRPWSCRRDNMWSSAAVDKEHDYFTPNSTDELIANSLRCAVKIVTSE